MAAKAGPDNTGFQQLKKDLRQKQPGQLYVFYGEETYLRDHYYDQLKRQILAGGMGDFNFHQLKEKEVNPRTLEEALDCLPMMGERSMVVVKDFDFFSKEEPENGEKPESPADPEKPAKGRKGKKKEKIVTDTDEYIRLFSTLPDYVCLVICYDTIPFKGNSRTKLYKAIQEHGTFVSFNRQEQPELRDWVVRHFRSLGKSIDSRLAIQMIERCGNLMVKLDGEISKVAAYSSQNVITWADIEAVTTPQPDVVIFALTNAIGERNYEKAMQVLGELYQLQESPFALLGLLIRQLRQLYSARLVLDSGRGQATLTQLWGIKDYPAQILMNNARRLSLKWCRESVARSFEVSMDIRSKGTPRAQEDVLTAFLLELAQTAAV